MDRLEAWGNTLSQITAYDIKSYYAAAKNVVLNYTEMEAKVREATNDNPWGTSSTLMQEIAQGTFNFQQFNEIMPTIYKRFTEKEAREWRQIYKALQLLEYLIKHGSERVIDDARSHISMIKILRNFHYIDDKGKDQGINVRNRAKELAELLSDLDRVRQERRKAKATRNKYVGTGSGGMSSSFASASGSRYGGFGSDSLHGGSGGGGDDYGRDRYASSSSRQGGGDDFEEYDAGEWEERPAGRAGASSSAAVSSSRPPGSSSTAQRQPSKPQERSAPEAKAPEVDFFSFDEEAAPVPPPPSTKTVPPPAPAVNLSLDDDFDDFQSAAPAPAVVSPTISATQSASAKPNVFDLLNSSNGSGAAATNQAAATRSPSTQTGGSGFFAMQAQPAQQNPPQSMMSPPLYSTPTAGPNYTSPISARPMSAVPASATSVGSSKPASTTSGPKPNSDPFGDDLFASFASMGVSGGTKSAASQGQKTSLAAMAKEQSSASIWGAAPGSAKPASGASVPFGGMGGGAGKATQPPVQAQGGFGGGDDDLLL